MSFGDGDLHERIRTLEGYNAALLDKIDYLKDVNGKLCAEINRQERVIEQLREKEATYMDANHEQGMQLIEQGKRIRELESSLEHKSINLVLHEGTIDELEALVRDMYGEFRYTPNACHWDAIEQFGDRMRKLGIEVRE